MTTIVYDENGKIWVSVDGQNEVPVVNVKTFDIPSDKRVVGIDMNTEEPILVDRKDSPEYLIQKLTERINSLEASQDALMSSQDDQDGAILEMSEMLFGGDM